MSGTLLSDLDSAGSVSGGNSSDDNAVQRILNEMNSSGPPQAPQVQSRQPPAQVMNSPNPNSTMQHSMDGVPPTAHIIGMEHPTSGDFAQMMYGRPTGNTQQYAQQNPYAQPMVQPPMYMGNMYKKNWYSDLAVEMKTPILVSLIFLVLSLPFVSILISHYFPSFVKGSGELTTFGLLLKSGLAGASFWVLHRIVAPLLISS
jgi:hypothetical protein